MKFTKNFKPLIINKFDQFNDDIVIEAVDIDNNDFIYVAGSIIGSGVYRAIVLKLDSDLNIIKYVLGDAPSKSSVFNKVEVTVDSDNLICSGCLDICSDEDGTHYAIYDLDLNLKYSYTTLTNYHCK